MVTSRRSAVFLFMEILNGGDLRVVDEICADDLLWHGPGGGTRGLRAFRQQFTPVLAAFPEFSITVQDMLGEGDRIACRFAYTGDERGPGAPGRSAPVTGIAIFRFGGGKIAEGWWQDDLGRVRAQPDAAAQGPTVLWSAGRAGAAA